MKELQSIKQRFGVISLSSQLDQALETAIRVAPTDLTVLVTGESGVGKEVFSKIIHALSPRKHNPFIAINCGAIPEGTINSELFGHEKGAFTGAAGERRGYFETVNGGTIFLDEIAEMPMDTQSFLLRILESGEYIRVGSSQVLKTDVRVIAATNVDLREKIKKGRFREDLYYRLNTVPIQIPPLRDRKDDILVLFRKFTTDIAEKYRTQPITLTEGARQILHTYHWPGNVRELKNVAEQLSVLSDHKVIDESKLQQYTPHVFERYLPVIASDRLSEEKTSFHEREILYKLLFDMKNDLTDLKKLVFELIQSNDLHISDARPFLNLQSNVIHAGDEGQEALAYSTTQDTHTILDSGKTRILKPVKSESPNIISPSQIVDDSLQLEDMEKDLIKKALQKHRGRRKEAADELGISERTLYRKIKQYEINA